MQTRFRVLKSKIIFLLFVFPACKIAYHKNVLQSNIAACVVKETVLFIPDSAINNKIFLGNATSYESFINNLSVEIVDGEFPKTTFLSSNLKEYLSVYFYYGNPENEVSLFEVGYSDSKVLKKTSYTKEMTFITESDIKLGDSVSSLFSKKGYDYKLSYDLNGDSLIRYEINDANNFVKRYNQVSYFSEYKIKFGLIILLRFGFDYP